MLGEVVECEQEMRGRARCRRSTAGMTCASYQRSAPKRSENSARSALRSRSHGVPPRSARACAGPAKPVRPARRAGAILRAAPLIATTIVEGSIATTASGNASIMDCRGSQGSRIDCDDGDTVKSDFSAGPLGTIIAVQTTAKPIIPSTGERPPSRTNVQVTSAAVTIVQRFSQSRLRAADMGASNHFS